MTDTSHFAAGKVSVRALLELACQQGELRLLDLHLGLFIEKQAGRAG
ncbi:MAG: hypothetical protein ACTFAK_04770 [Candidatus Electronema sp. VV]